MNTEQIPMVIECTDRYQVAKLEDGRTKIWMIIPKGFESLWMSRLTDLHTTREEIEYYRSEDNTD
jgi:hypothetical protein